VPAGHCGLPKGYLRPFFSEMAENGRKYKEKGRIPIKKRQFFRKQTSLKVDALK
jgi:hypothetical protein